MSSRSQGLISPSQLTEPWAEPSPWRRYAFPVPSVVSLTFPVTKYMAILKVHSSTRGYLE